MSKPATISLEMIQNSTDVSNIYLENPPGTKWDLTDIASATFTVKDRPGGTQVFQKTLVSGLEAIDAPAGHLRLTVVPADTSAVVIPTYFNHVDYICDLDMTDSQGNKFVPARGRFTIFREV